MPIYEYECADCGVFSLIRPLSQSGRTADCPECGEISSKVFPVVNLRGMRPDQRKAHEVNERSSHAPHVCGSGCSHGRSTKSSERVSAGEPVLKRSTKQSSRPWMLGH